MTSEEDLRTSIETYEEQLQQIEDAILHSTSITDKENLISLKNDIKQLIELTSEAALNSLTNNKPTGGSDADDSCKSDSDPLSSEYAAFMAEMAKEGVSFKTESSEISNDKDDSDLQEHLKSLEGMKCRAPHTHNWGDTVYHNAMVSSVISNDEDKSFDDIKVRVLFINPTHQEMLPCPYFLETECKFSEEKCKFSHGEIVPFSTLQEYVEPKFELLRIGSPVLAKQHSKLWHRATVRQMYDEKCVVKFDTNQKSVELELHDVLPLENETVVEVDSDSEVEGDDDNKDVINMSLMNTPSSMAMGEWEKYSKGIGSKLMMKMGYVVGTGLGRHSDGRLDPVTAVILPAGKSLDHCMQLRENAGGDKNLFSAERKLKRLQKMQEIRSRKLYEQEKKRVDMFDFINDSILGKQTKSADFSKSKHRQDIKKDSSRELNVTSLKIDEDIKRAQRELFKIRESMTRHNDVNSQVHKSLKVRLEQKQNELETLKTKLENIYTEKSFRLDKRKLTVF